MCCVRCPELLYHAVSPIIDIVYTQTNASHPVSLPLSDVSPGQRVEEGEALAVVEAMKMQNVLRSIKKGVITKVNAHVGSHLKVDQVIIEYE